MPSLKLRIAGPTGELSAALDWPLDAPRAFALLAHCFTCSKESRAATYVSRALAELGIATLRLDFSAAELSSNVDDLVAAADWLRTHHGAPQILVGHSLGGVAALLAAPRITGLRAVATIGTPHDPARTGGMFGDVLDTIRRDGEVPIDLGGRSMRVGRKFLEEIEQQDADAAIAALGHPLLVMHAPQDAIVGIDNAARIFAAAGFPKSFVSLDGADHLLVRKEDAGYAASVLASWASRYLDAEPEQPAAPPPGVHVAEAGDGRFAQIVHVGRHRLRADEPVPVGGDDSGPGPYDLLLAALGACTSMTIRMYADQKQWPLDRVGVSLRHKKIHAVDCAECETVDGRVDRIERVLELEGHLDATQRQRLLEIANKCPVHRTLLGEITIPTRLADDD